MQKKDSVTMTEIHPFRLHADDETANLFAGWTLPCHESLTGDEHNDGDIRSSIVVGSAFDTNTTFAAPPTSSIMLHEMELARLTPFPTSPMPLPTPSPVPMPELTYTPVLAMMSTSSSSLSTTTMTVESLVCDEDFQQIEKTFFRAGTKHSPSQAPTRRKRKYTACTKRVIGRRPKKLGRTRLTDEKITPPLRANLLQSSASSEQQKPISAGTWMTLCPNKVAIFSSHEKHVIYGSSPQTQMISQNEVFFIYDTSYIYPCSTHATTQDCNRYDGAQFQHPIDAYFLCFSSERTELCFVLANAMVTASTMPTCVYYSNSMRCIIPIDKCHIDKNAARTFITNSLNSFFWLHIIQRCASPSLGKLFSTCLQHGVLFAPTTQVELHSDFDFNPALVESILWLPLHESSKYFDPFNEPSEHQQLEKNSMCFLSISFNVWSLYKDFKQLPLYIQHFLTHGCVLHDMCKVVHDTTTIATIATTTIDDLVSQQLIRARSHTHFQNAFYAKKHASVTMTILWYMKGLFGDSRFNCKSSMSVSDNETTGTFVTTSETDRLRIEAIHAFMYEKIVRQLHPYNMYHHVPLWLRMLERERYPQTILNGIEYDVPCFKVESDKLHGPTATALNVHYTIVSDRLNERRDFQPIVGGWIFDRTDAQLIDAIRHMHATATSSGHDDIENTCTVVLVDKEKIHTWTHLTSCADDRFSRRVIMVTSGLLSSHDDVFAGCMAQYPTMILCTIDMLELFTQRLQAWRTRVRTANWIMSRFLSTLDTATYASDGLRIVRIISTCMKACDCLPLWIACALPASYTELESFFVFHVILMLLRTSDPIAAASSSETSQASVSVIGEKKFAERTQDTVIAFALLLGSSF